MSLSKFDFDQHLNEHQLSARIADLASILERDPNLRPIVGEFKRKFKIPDADQQPEFRFNLAERSFETIPEEVRAAHRNLKKVTYVQGDRFFVSRDFNEDPNTQIWDEVASASSVDLHAESSQLSFLDSEKKTVDWPQSLANLNRMIANKPYSEAMMKACLLRFVNHYEPAQTEYLKERTSNEIAHFLISLDAKFDRVAFHRAKLLQSCRAKGEPLISAVMKIKNIIDQIYPLAQQPLGGAGGDNNAPNQAQAAAAANIPEHEVTSVANRILINAIVSFLVDDLATPLLAKVQSDHSSNRLLSYQEYLKLAVGAEAKSQLYPSMPLQFGRRLNTRIPIMGLNNFEVPLIHPSMNIPKKKGFFPHNLSHYFPSNLEEDEHNFVPILGPPVPNRQNFVGQVPPPRPTLPVPPVLHDILRPQNYGQMVPDQYIRVNRRDVPAGVQIQLDNQGEFFLLQNERVYIDAEPGYSNPEVPSNPPSAGSNTPQSGMSDDIYEDVIHMSNMLEKIMKRIPTGRPNGQAMKTDRPKSPNFEKKNTSNYDSRDRNRSQSSNRQRDLSTGRDQHNYSGQNRQPSRERYPRGNSQNRQPSQNDYRPRERSNDRNRGASDRNRSFSRGRPRDQTPYRRDSRDNSRNYSQNMRQNQGYRGNRGNSFDRSRSRYSSGDRSYNDRRDISRDRSLEAKRFVYKDFAASKLYPHMKKGFNCSNSYNPMLKKSCSKCQNEASHHEFECSVYDRWNENRCTACDKYNHFSKDCKELSKFPPKHADSSAISSNPN